MEEDFDFDSGFCVSCPDHEACATGYSCPTVKITAAAASFKKAMLGVGEAAKKAGAAMSKVSSVTVATRPRMMGGMEGDIIQSVHTTVPIDSGREVVDRVIEEAEHIIREHARIYGYTMIGNFDVRSRVRNDTAVVEVEVIVEMRLRAITEGVWGEVRSALEQDKVDLEIAKRSEGVRGMDGAPVYASGGFITASSGWKMSSPPLAEAPAGTMHLDRSGDIYVRTDGKWVRIGSSPGTVD